MESSTRLAVLDARVQWFGRGREPLILESSDDVTQQLPAQSRRADRTQEIHVGDILSEELLEQDKPITVYPQAPSFAFSPRGYAYSSVDSTGEIDLGAPERERRRRMGVWVALASCGAGALILVCAAGVRFFSSDPFATAAASRASSGPRVEQAEMFRKEGPSLGVSTGLMAPMSARTIPTVSFESLPTRR